MEPVLQEFVPGQEGRVVSLLRQASRRWTTLDSTTDLEAHWNWKHRKGPLGPSLVSVAVAGGELVGCNHTIPVRVRVGEQFLSCGYTCDAAVQADSRRRGMLSRLVDHSNGLRRTAGMEFCYFITFNPFLVKPYSRDYEQMPLSCTSFLKVRDVRLHLRSKSSGNRWLDLLGCTLLALKNKTTRNKTGKKGLDKPYDIRDVIRFDDRADAFWSDAASSFTLIGERTGGFLNWRFCDPRGGDFLVKTAVENNKMIAYIAAKTERLNPEYPQGYIADVLALPGRADAADALIRDAVAHMHASGINAVRCMLPKRSPYAAALRRCGFMDTRQIQPVFIAFPGTRLKTLDKAALGLPGGYHFTYADLDIV
jgi:hypothetical protein